MIEDFHNGTVRDEKDAFERAKAIAMEQFEENRNQGHHPDVLTSISINSIEDLCSALLKYGPLYASYKSSFGTNHAIVITGVNVLTDTVYTNNSDCIDSALKGTQTFYEFTNGLAGISGNNWKLYCIYYFNWS